VAGGQTKNRSLSAADCTAGVVVVVYQVGTQG